MFPREVAEGLFSMQADTAGCALSVSMVLDETGAVVECGAMTSLVHPMRLTYTALDERLAADDAGDEELRALREVGRSTLWKASRWVVAVP